MTKKETIYKAAAYLVIFVIFFFLVKGLIENWQKMRQYQFTLDYVFLLFAFVIFFFLIISLGLVWSRILRILEPDKKISYFQTIKIFLYAWFGKYLPGKIWSFAGLVYFGRKYGLNRKKLAISAIYRILLSTSSAFLFSFLLLGLARGGRLFDYYLISLFIIVGSLILVHPKVFYRAVNLVFKRFKNIEISPADFLSHSRIIEILFYYFVCYALSSLGFFFVVRSLIYVPFCDIMRISGAFVLASALGFVAVFAPGGLGVREGALVVLLQPYFPLSLAVLISLVARIWVTVGEAALLAFVYLISKVKKI